VYRLIFLRITYAFHDLAYCTGQGDRVRDSRSQSTFRYGGYDNGTSPFVGDLSHRHGIIHFSPIFRGLDKTLHRALITCYKLLRTRNSAVAEKPRDAFVQM